MSFLKSKHSGWTTELTRTPYMGGGGGGQSPPTTTYSQTSNIPDYAKPYVETMLGATQKQLFKMDDSGVTGFEPYKPYSKDPNDYVADYSPLQKQAQSGAANLQVPGQYGQASQMTGMAGLGSLGLAGQMAGAGQQYAMGATDPRTTQAYMSPYMQNVVDYQKSQALRDYQMGQPMMQAKAVGQGAFGGNRLALQQSEAQRGLMSQLQGIEATGAQSAFQNAQQAQQYGANLGLQGQQAALGGLGQYGQMAGQLGQLGTAQLGAQQGIIGTQAAQGATQQAQEQQKINQQIQDYAIQQQYPLMQLGFMSNMLRGLPMQAQTTQLYQAQPTNLQQGMGLIGAGASLFGGQGKAGGGQIKEMAEGGIAGYKYGGAIPSQKLEGMADKLDLPQLQALLKDPQLDKGERQVFEDALTDKSKDKARYAGIGAAGGGLFDTMGYAGGGILAFAGEDESLVEEEKVNQKPTTVAEQLALQRSLGPKGKLGESTEKDIAARKEEGDKRFSKADRIAMAEGFLEFGGTAAPGGLGQAGIAGLKKYTQGYSKAIEGQEAFKAETAKMNRELENARRAEERGDVKGAMEAQAKYEDIQAKLKAAQISASGAHAAVNLKREEKAAIKADLAKSLGREPTMAEILSAYTKATSVADESSDARLRVAANTAYQKWEAGIVLDPVFRDLQKKASKGDEAAAAKIEQLKATKRQQITAEIMGAQAPQTASAPTPSVMSPDKDGNISIPGKGTFKQLPNGNYVKVG
jgi:hypothetical protein